MNNDGFLTVSILVQGALFLVYMMGAAAEKYVCHFNALIC